MKQVEYRVRPVTRYIVTRAEMVRFVGTDDTPVHTVGSSGSVAGRGEYPNADTAYEVAYALCKAEHDAAGTPLDDKGFVYPQHPGPVTPSL